jgi:ribonuclease BN (tRNA processing enzyme)
MMIILGGVRGSCPVAQPEFMTYGGETTSLLIVGEADDCILIDAGTGVRLLGKALLKAGGHPEAWLFMTHYHLDHLAGLPMLPVLHHPGWTVTFAAPARPGAPIRDTMARMLADPFWPLQVEDLKADIRYHELPGPVSAAPYRCGGIEVRWCPLHHAGGCSAYRFDEPATGGSLVIATDMEWGLSTPEERARLEALITTPHPADLLIMDGQYDDATIAAHRGWGHSTWQECAALAERLGVPRLLVTHHDPSADDARLEAIEVALRARLPGARLARGGMAVTVPDRTPTPPVQPAQQQQQQ